VQRGIGAGQPKGCVVLTHPQCVCITPPSLEQQHRHGDLQPNECSCKVRRLARFATTAHMKFTNPTPWTWLDPPVIPSNPQQPRAARQTL